MKVAPVSCLIIGGWTGWGPNEGARTWMPRDTRVRAREQQPQAHNGEEDDAKHAGRRKPCLGLSQKENFPKCVRFVGVGDTVVGASRDSIQQAVRKAITV